MVDSGSQRCLMNGEAFMALQTAFPEVANKLQPCDIQIRAATGTIIKLMGIINLTLHVDWNKTRTKNMILLLHSQDI